MIEIHIKTQFGVFLFKLHPKLGSGLNSYIERMKRAIAQGSVGPGSDWTVGNAMNQKSSVDPKILSCYCSIVAT